MPGYPLRPDRTTDVALTPSEPPHAWLDLRADARVRASSEDAQHPIAHAFSAVHRTGWSAAEPGEQRIDVRFREPRDLTRIQLVFEDAREERTQQFTISWSSRRGEAHGEVVRQQFNFSPGGATREVEDYRVELRGVDALSIRIVPDLAGRAIRATLALCRVA